MFHSILVPIDVEHESTYAPVLPVAIKLAQDHGAVLHLLAVVQPVGSAFVSSFFPEDFELKLSEQVKSKLAQVATESDFGGIEPVLHLAQGSIYEEILLAASSLSVDLIVIAAGRPEQGSFLLGSNAAQVVRHADASVLVVRNQPS